VTCNMHYEQGNAEKLDSVIRSAEADVVTLQEWKQNALPNALREPGWNICRVQNIFLASRYPVVEASELGKHSSGPHGSVASFKLSTISGLVTFFSVHLESPRDALVDVIHSEDGKVDVRNNSERRAQQMAWLSERSRSSPAPVIVAGDFNTPPESALFHRGWDHFEDAFSEGGWGWGYTFVIRRTRVRIDHILGGPGWRCVCSWVGAPVGSPHRPVIADLVWTGSSQRIKDE
jgi:vancomycin resistance protein VanJ